MAMSVTVLSYLNFQDEGALRVCCRIFRSCLMDSRYGWLVTIAHGLAV